MTETAKICKCVYIIGNHDFLENNLDRMDAISPVVESLNNPNFASDLRIPGAAQYTSVILDRELARYLAGEISADRMMKNVENGWNEVTDDFGRERQIKLYRATLGLSSSL